MSDIKIENAICQAIDIIASKKIAQASFDKTIKCVINQIVNEATGEYKVSYGDSKNITVYSNNPEFHYKKDQVVYVLIPGNDWNRKKVIINSTVDSATTFNQSINEKSNLYNRIGVNAAKGSIELCSYQNTYRDVYKEDGSVNLITINQQAAKKYIKQGNGLALGVTVQTKLDDGQVGGDYGIIYNLKFKSKNKNEDAAVRSYIVSSRNVIGTPYSLITPTPIEIFEKQVDTANFDGIQSIQVFCNGFKQDQNISTPDIFFTSPLFGAGIALTDDEASNYCLHIDYSENGDTIDENLNTIKLIAELKVKGKLVNKNIEYYWFRQNGTIFRGDNSGKYSGYAGEGWECLNPISNNRAVPFKDINTFYFSSDTSYVNKTENAALAQDRTTKILCVAIYGNEWVRGQAKIYNMMARNVYIDSNDVYTDETGNIVNRTVYYLDAGSPTLTCKYSGEILNNLTYTWSVVSSTGRVIQKKQATDKQKYQTIKSTYDTQIEALNKIAINQQSSYKNNDPYKAAETAWNNIKDIERVEENVYYNIPIKEIAGYSKIVCTITQGNKYIGTGSIILYNKQILEGMYSLNINNGVQIFQYDENGNSPFTQEKDRTALDEIPKLSFTLLDNNGAEVSYEQIIRNGEVNWLFPAYDSLLLTTETNGKKYNDVGLNSADKALVAGLYNIYKNRQTFSYSIEDIFDKNKINNDIKLVVKYNDLILQAYTNFTFPKNGDPGTNGTDYIAVITTTPSSDRLYFSNHSTATMYNDSGANVDKLNFLLYNNNSTVVNTGLFWSCPPKTTSGDKNKGVTYLNVSTAGKPTLKNNKPTTVSKVKEDKPINIVRGKSKVGKLECFAECPINYVYTIEGYRIKIKPKTGFKYVVYKEDGTRPEYDSSKPFEIIIEKQRSVNGIKFYSTSNIGTLDITWSTIGNISIEGNNKGLQKYFKPGPTFDGTDLTTAIIAEVKENNKYIGFIHIPIYMILNRYGHNAINGWDGNSIELNAGGDTILAPQVGAGRKDEGTNTFTGVVIGSVKPNGSTTTEDGLFGYNDGQRTIFLDAQTGKAQFGRNDKAKIVIDPSKDTAQLYSGNYSTYAKTGMLIDLTTPEIKFGSGNFTVDKNGNMTAKGNGTIAGWTIGANKLNSNNGKVYLQSSNNVNDYAFYSNGTFYVTQGGKLHAANGDIAGWNISSTRLYKDNTGMASSGLVTKDINANLPTPNASVAFHAGTSSAKNNFYITHDGYLFSKSGNIGGWNITNTNLNKTSGNGEIILSPDQGISLKNKNDSNKYFTVNNQGYIESTSGKIGGWNIEKGKLFSDNNQLVLQATGSTGGSIKGGTSSGNNWSISGNGNASFKGVSMTEATVKGDITANTLNANKGSIGGWNITTAGLNAGNMNIKNDGSMSGPGWSISNAGNAYFNHVTGITLKDTNGNNGTISGGSISGSSLSGNTFNPYSNYNSDGQSIGNWVDGKIDAVEVRTKDLIVTGQVAYQNRSVTWARVLIPNPDIGKEAFVFTDLTIPTVDSNNKITGTTTVRVLKNISTVAADLFRAL